MKKRLLWFWVGSGAIVLLLAGVPLTGRARVAPQPQASNFRNIQVLTMMTDREIQQTMQAWAEQFGVTCFECHVQGDFASDEMRRKQVARQMAEMVLSLDQTTFFQESGWSADCYMCHKGSFNTEMAP